MASLAYVVTQVHLAVMFHCYATDHLAAPFALSSSSVFCRTDTTTDLEGFYDSVLDFLDDSDEKNDIHELLDWWNWWVQQLGFEFCFQVNALISG